MDVQQSEYERHTHVNSVLHLPEISSPWIVIHLNRYLIHSWEWMKYIHVFRCETHLFLIQYIEIFHAYVVFLIEETLFLNPGHVQDIKFGNRIIQADYFLIRNVLLVQHIMAHVIG